MSNGAKGMSDMAGKATTCNPARTDQLFTSANRAIFIASASQVEAATESGSRCFFLRHRFLGDGDTGERNDPGGNLGSAVLTEGRLVRQFSVSDLG